jgi:neutral ceramidase
VGRLFGLLATGVAVDQEKGVKEKQKGLAVGMAVEDITPPLYVGLLMSSVEGRWEPFQSVRTPLKARALVIESEQARVALVSLDLLVVDSVVVGGWTRFKQALAAAAPERFEPDHIVVTCTHTHTAPDSSRTTDLYRSQEFRTWMEQVREKIARAIATAAAATQPCTLELASTELRGFSLQRRVPMGGRIVMSDSLQPIAPELFERGPVDRRVHGIWFRGRNGSAIATLVHAVCHPVHEMCLPQVSADFPGELCAALEEWPDNGAPIYFNGAAGDINPPTVSEGAEAAKRHGGALAEVVMKARGEARSIEVEGLVFRSRTVPLPLRWPGSGPSHETCPAQLSALGLGPLGIVLLPGEIFTETALAIEQESPFQHTLIFGFAESSIGYVPTARAFEEGGYEVGPGKWSYLQAGAESILCREAVELLREVRKAQPAKPAPGAYAQDGRVHDEPALVESEADAIRPLKEKCGS